MIPSTVLIIGDCGSGKTWVMKELIKLFGVTKPMNHKTLHFVTNDKINILGKYEEDHLFAGSDRLSMSVITDVAGYYENHPVDVTIAEGDRFTNQRFINESKPTIIRINDNGNKGRELRKSEQTSRHIQAIRTRVNNIPPSLIVPTSKECLEVIINIINEDTSAIQQDKQKYSNNNFQVDLFG